jgi:hypothetical protein
LIRRIKLRVVEVPAGLDRSEDQSVAANPPLNVMACRAGNAIAMNRRPH